MIRQSGLVLSRSMAVAAAFGLSFSILSLAQTSGCSSAVGLRESTGGSG